MLDDWVFNLDPSLSRLNVCLSLWGNPGQRALPLSRSKPFAGAEWDKLLLVFITYHHTGQALKLRRQSKESCVPLF